MSQQPSADTQPIRLDHTSSGLNDPGGASEGGSEISPRPRSKLRILIGMAALLAVLLLVTSILLGTAAGYQQGFSELKATGTAGLDGLLDQQAAMADQDILAGRYEIARQRYEFVLAARPDYPGVNEKLAGVLALIYATATPTPTDLPTPTATLTPTPDIRPVQDRFSYALSLAAAGDWDGVITALVGLRKDAPDFNATRVDGVIYLALRYRGVDKIYQTHDLAGGIYDLSLAENFGPLDLEAAVARDLARLYLIGSGFWEAYPEQAVYFFAQVAAAAPYLRDASGWTATERYRGALIQYGDQFANAGDWCGALQKYQIAAGIYSEPGLDSRMQKASEQCLPDATLPAVTLTLTSTPSPTLATPSPTFSPATETETAPPPIPATPTETPAPPTETLPPPPTDSPVPPSFTPPAP